ncbi:hypothetical protein QNI23_007665 [Bermanella sp. WJH001]|uniref:hypothetical protein n=1 Tax=Bermanella sp. WJH001 TaxID=3048005 RepID=UPI0024BEBA04|nr:hypothetical protein [Bermanella sp. WJH001]MDJ1536868.1 hypothetical protein [Bermanella sp. WJH001]
MQYFNVPSSLKEVFGEKQTSIEVAATLISSLATCLIVYCFLYPSNDNNHIAVIFGFVLVWDVLAGCIANFTYGTNQYYATRDKSRWVFIAIHFHIIAIAWLLDGPLYLSVWVWLFTITAAISVNLLQGQKLQLFVAVNFVCIGLILIFLLAMPAWFSLVSIFFLLKVVLSFAVDHYKNNE